MSGCAGYMPTTSQVEARINQLARERDTRDIIGGGCCGVEGVVATPGTWCVQLERRSLLYYAAGAL